MNRSAVLLIITISLIFSIGLLMVFNTSSAQIIDRSLNGSTHTALLKQLYYGIFGLFVGLLAYKLGYQRLLNWSPYLLIFLTMLLAALFIPGVAQNINGAKRWLNVFGFSFQPSECAKILVPTVFIDWLSRQSEVTFKSFCKVLFILAVPIALILLEPDNGTTAIIACLMAILFLLAKIKWSYWALPLFVLVSLAGAAATQMPHARDRIQIYLHPELDLRGKGHQPHQAKIAAGSGGLVGRGLGESIQKLNYLPEARSDYIAAIYAEESGFIGMVVLIFLYAVFGFTGFSIAFQSKDKSAFLLAAVFTFLISIQAFLNLGIVSGLLPSKGMTLPFFSQGGTSLMINLGIVFLLLDISRKQGLTKSVR
jgi:cell division protein FtsW